MTDPTETTMDDQTSAPDRRGVLTGLLGAGAVAGALTAFGAAAPAAADPRQPRGRFVEKEVMPVNVKDYGATGDGETDDSAAIQAAITAAAEAGVSVFVPAGTYLVSEPWRAEGLVVLRGDGMWQTMIAVASEGGFIDAGTRAPMLVVEDIAFDNLGNKQIMLQLDASVIHDFTFRRCRFTNLRSENSGPDNADRNGYPAVELYGVGDGAFVDCLWHNPAIYAGQGTAVTLQSWTGEDGAEGTGGHRLRFAGGNRILWLNNGIRTETNIRQDGRFAGREPAVLDHLEIDGAYLDGFWWLLPAAHSGEGDGVTYSETELSDPAADFSVVPANDRPHVINVRAMPVRVSGTIGRLSPAMLVDSSADFPAAGVKRMDIVRSDGRWAVVANTPTSAETPGVVSVEQWLDDETLLPTDPPPEGTEYTLYGIIHGAAVAASTTTLTVEDWRNLYNGSIEVPAAGTRYEVLPIRPTYLLSIGYGGILDLLITNSTFRRGWADMVGGRAQSSRIIGNLFEDGQEVGCTITGGFTSQHVIGNTFRHTGNCAVFFNASESTLIGNHASGSWWKLTSDRSDFWVVNGRRNRISDNLSIAGDESVDRGGCVTIEQRAVSPVRGPVEASVDNVLSHNRRYGHTDDEPDVKLEGPGPIEGNQIIGSTSVALLEGAAGQLVETVSAGSPEGVLPAAPGSVYRRTDGEAGEVLYVKQSGTGADGWVQAGSGGDGGEAPPPVLLALAAADRTRANTNAANGSDGIDPELSVQVEAGATYLVEGYLVFNSTESADVKIGWESPGESSMSWTVNGPASNARSHNAAVHRKGLFEGSQPRVGGIDGDAVLLPTGKLSVGDSGGQFALRWAQGAAEESDTTRGADSWLRLTKVG